MLYGDRIWKFLPGFLKAAQTGLYDLCRAVGEALDEIMTAVAKLQPQGMANRLPGFEDYYASDERKKDLVILGASRLVSKRENETWAEFETRLQQFPENVKWFGTKKGLEKEIERTGLVVDSIAEMRDDLFRWIILSLAEQCNYPEDQLSHIYELGKEDLTMRGTTEYGRDDIEDFTFVVRLSGSTTYSKQDVKRIIKAAKPPFTKGYVFFPGLTVAEEVL